MKFFDTHAHIHFDNYDLDADEVLKGARAEGVEGIIAVACDLATSQQSVEFAKTRENVWASVGVHPHEATDFVKNSDSVALLETLLKAKTDKLVAIGECGLDYHYENSPKSDQVAMLEIHLQLATDNKLPVIFHVREAHEDFWPIVDNFSGIRGVLHSFSATSKELDQAVKRGLFIGLNGIMTFTSDDYQLAAARAVPKDHLVLETDAPYLTPKPFRGKICKPEHVKITAEFLANLRGENLEELATYTTQNARRLFGI